MNLGWQEYVAIGLTAIAAGYLLYRGWLVLYRRGRAGCGTCSSCPESSTKDTAKEKPVISVDSLVESGRQKAARPGDGNRETATR